MRRISTDVHDSPSSQEYRLISGEKVSFRASVDTLVALDQLVRNGVKAFPKRGLEVGGLLTGSLESEICLDAVEPLPMEYRSGPVFRPSAADLLFVKQSVEKAQAAGTSIIGHFRSQTSGEPQLTVTDQTIADLLKLREPLLLLIPASAAGVEPARVYRRVNGEYTYLLSFPLMEDVPQPQPLANQPERAMVGPLPVAPRTRWRWWALAGLAVGLGFGIFLSRSVWQTRPAYVLPTRSSVGLELHPAGDRLKVQWNPASPPVAEGFSGILTVQDGARRLQIPLDRQQLRQGSTVYYPESGWVEVRLEIYRDGNHYTGESVAMATGLPAALAASKLVTSDQRTAPKQPLIDTPPASGTPRVQSKRVVEASTQRPPRSGLVASQTALALPQPPPVSAAQAAAPVLPPAAPTAPPARQPDTSGAGAGGSIAPFALEPAIRYETAVPIRKVRPAVPADLHSILPEAVSIEIKVEIDATGKVVNATPMGGLTATQKLLAPQAVQAARLWRFEPARKNGTPVESESLLKFDFEREGR